MLRYICINAFIGLDTIILSLWGFMVYLFDRSGNRVHRLAAVPWAKAILWVSGVKAVVRGRDNVDPAVPRVYMTNHQSSFDIYALLALLPVDFKFILKQELMKVPVLGWGVKMAGYIALEREEPRKALQSMNKAAQRIKGGTSVMVFPEGTRSPDGRLQPFKKGGFSLALKSGCDIVPVTIVNSYKVVPKGSLKINKGSFQIHIGEPIPVSNYSKRDIHELMERVRGVMKENLEETQAS